MASGDTLLVFNATSASFPAANYATLDTRNQHLVLDFDAAADETAYFSSVMPRNYAGTTGLTVTIHWSATSATSGTCVWDVAFEAQPDDTFDLDADGFAAIQTVSATTATATGELAYDVITFTDGAQMDSVAVGESFRMSVMRNIDPSDDMAGDAEIHRIEIKET